MSLFWSLKGTKWQGRAYWSSGTGSIFLNVIYRDTKTFGEFIADLVCTMFHEYLHLFFKFKLGKYQNSCKTIIDPISVIICNEMAKDDEFVRRIVDDFKDVSYLTNNQEIEE